MNEYELDVDRLSAMIKRAGIALGELADKIQVSQEHLYRIRKGQSRNVSAITLCALAIALDTSMEYLMGVTDNDLSIEALVMIRDNGLDYVIQDSDTVPQLQQLVDVFSDMTHEQRQATLEFFQMMAGTAEQAMNLVEEKGERGAQ